MDVTAKIKDFINDSVQPLYDELKNGVNEVVSKMESYDKDLHNMVSKVYQSEQEQFDNLNSSIKHLNENVVELIEQVGLLQEVVDSMKEKMKGLEVLETENAVLQTKPIVQVFYSKMVDTLDPLGFKISNLKSNMASCAFKITMLDGQNGQYETIEDSEIQQELLSAFNPLITDSSLYDSIPPNATRIVVVKPGMLQKEHDVLRILKKQTIKLE